MFIGLMIILMGVLFLLQNLNLIQGDIWNIIWPLFIIAAGLQMMFDHKKWRCSSKEEEEEKENKQ